MTTATQEHPPSVLSEGVASPNIDEGVDELRQTIFYLLEIYPYLSRGMLQQGLGPAQKPKIWEPILQAEVAKGNIKVEEVMSTSPAGRSLGKTVYHLPKFPYPPITKQGVEDLLDTNPECL